MFNEHPGRRPELIQLESNERLEGWVRRFDYLIGLAGISVITDMQRGMIGDCGI